MTTNEVFLKNLAIAGYRSFGDMQYFPSFAKVNLFIGGNNSGKSNILKFIHDIYPKVDSPRTITLDILDRHLFGKSNLGIGTSMTLRTSQTWDGTELKKFVLSLFPDAYKPGHAAETVLKLFHEKAKLDQSSEIWFCYGGDHGNRDQKIWELAFSCLAEKEIYDLWTTLTNQLNGNKNTHWIPEIIKKLTLQLKTFDVAMVPAIRKIGIKGSPPTGFSGEGIIEKLVMLQNSDVHNQADRLKSYNINKFLQTVTDNKTAKIEITHERDTILVHMDDKSLPLEHLGTGIQEVIILAAAATVLDRSVICMEEPELHLNPVLQKN
jgi:hypothetical protein